MTLPAEAWTAIAAVITGTGGALGKVITGQNRLEGRMELLELRLERQEAQLELLCRAAGIQILREQGVSEQQAAEMAKAVEQKPIRIAENA